MEEPLPRLSSPEAAALLGVKTTTLYAYVARGLIGSRRAERGGSTFDPLELEAFRAARRSADRSPRRVAATNPGVPVAALESDLTLLRGDELYYRGEPATGLVLTRFEDAAEFLWTGERSRGSGFAAAPVQVDRARHAVRELGEGADAPDQVALAVLTAGLADPLRRDLSPDATHTAGRAIIAAAIAALPDLAPSPEEGSVAERLLPKLTALPAERADVALLNAALVLLMDHDLAASTFAARVAASARADPYSCITAAIGTASGALHGGVGGAARTLLTDTMLHGRPERALAKQVADGRGTPGFGHVIYRDRDPRAHALFERMRPLPRYGPVLAAVGALTRAVDERLRRPANVDLALAAIEVANAMRPLAGQTIFTLARTVGWIAHVSDEYRQAPLRLRPTSRYVGTAPSRHSAGAGR